MGDRFNFLSTREKEILMQISEGKKNNEIGSDLFISTHTVESHKIHLIEKLELKNSNELLAFAVKNKKKISVSFENKESTE